MNFRAALCLTFALTAPIFAQVSEQPPSVERPIPEREQIVPPIEAPRHLRFVSEATSQSYIAKFQDNAGTLTNSHIVDDASGVSLSGVHFYMNLARLVLMYPALQGYGNDVSGMMAGSQTLGVGFNSEGTFTGTPAQMSGRQMYFADFQSARTRGAIDSNGTWWFGASPSSYGLKVSEPGLATIGVTISSAGALGVGTDAPAEKMHIYNDAAGASFLRIENPSTLTGAHAGWRAISALAATSFLTHGTRDAALVRWGMPLSGWSELLNYNGNGQIIGTSQATPLVFGTATVERMRILGNGNVGIGTASPSAKLHVVGDVIVNGNITGAKVIGAVYQDLAEWVPASSDMTPGTVVVLNLDKTNEVMPSSRRYDTSVAGVVSAAPGIILGVGDDSKEQIATTGRVKVRVDARPMPIRVGDLLVTSDVAGTAMRSEPLEINGRPFHQPGTIIGKALEPLSEGVGEILVLLSMQ